MLFAEQADLLKPLQADAVFVRRLLLGLVDFFDRDVVAFAFVFALAFVLALAFVFADVVDFCAASGVATNPTEDTIARANQIARIIVIVRLLVAPKFGSRSTLLKPKRFWSLASLPLIFR